MIARRTEPAPDPPSMFVGLPSSYGLPNSSVSTVPPERSRVKAIEAPGARIACQCLDAEWDRCVTRRLGFRARGKVGGDVTAFSLKR